jgi:hypothetical protein
MGQEKTKPAQNWLGLNEDDNWHSNAVSSKLHCFKFEDDNWHSNAVSSKLHCFKVGWVPMKMTIGIQTLCHPSCIASKLVGSQWRWQLAFKRCVIQVTLLQSWLSPNDTLDGNWHSKAVSSRFHCFKALTPGYFPWYVISFGHCQRPLGMRWNIRKYYGYYGKGWGEYFNWAGSRVLDTCNFLL